MAKLILTDSGGIQEEAPTFGTPVLVMRYETERKEGIEAGFAQLVGANASQIISVSDSILSKNKEQTRKNGCHNPYGDGHASQKIQEIINAYFKKD
jgi:UDP-N-acetylglucosamine 2-epimerase (non-hydrolysing)